MRAVSRRSPPASRATPAGSRASGSRIARLPPPGLGLAASLLLLAATLGYGAVAGDHVAAIVEQLKEARDAAANAIGFRIAAISLTGPKEVSREKILATAGVTTRASLLFLDADAARTRLLSNPWIADAAVLKLYPDRLQITITERQAFALWQKDGRVSVIAADGTILEPFIDGRYLDLPLVVGRGAERQADDFLSILDRFPDIRSALRASILVAGRRWDIILKNGIDVHLPETDVAQALERLVALDRDKKLLVARHHRGRSAAARSRQRAAHRRRRAGPRGRAAGKRQEEEKGRRRMSALHYGVTPKMKPISPRRSALVAALDIGSSKIACLIARLRPHPPQQVLTRRSHAIEVIGFGHTGARGTKAGAVVNLAQAEEAIRQAVDAAERMAGVEIEAVVLSVAAGRLGSELFAAEIELVGSAVSAGDIARVLAAGSRQSLRDGRAVLHSIPVGYSIDGGNGIRDPRGMLGACFGVDMHVATTDIAAARNLMLAVERCHLSVEAMVAAPYVAGLAVIADDEADLGVAVVDMGAGTTTMSVFVGGGFVHAEGFALGGHHVTMDIARGLNTGLADAERIKTLYGSVLVGASDERDMITVPPINEDDREQAQHVSRAYLVHIVKPRVEEILEMVRDRLAASSFAAEPRGRVILTGGASQLTGLPELAAGILGRPVRVGRPLGIAGLPEAAKGPAFAAAAGLLVYPQAAHLEHFETRGKRYLRRGTGGGYFARVGQWLREGF